MQKSLVATRRSVGVHRPNEISRATWWTILGSITELQDQDDYKGVVLNLCNIKEPLCFADVQVLKSWHRHVEESGVGMAVAGVHHGQNLRIEARLAMEFNNCHQTEEEAVASLQ